MVSETVVTLIIMHLLVSHVILDMNYQVIVYLYDKLRTNWSEHITYYIDPGVPCDSSASPVIIKCNCIICVCVCVYKLCITCV